MNKKEGRSNRNNSTSNTYINLVTVGSHETDMKALKYTPQLSRPYCSLGYKEHIDSAITANHLRQTVLDSLHPILLYIYSHTHKYVCQHKQWIVHPNCKIPICRNVIIITTGQKLISIYNECSFRESYCIHNYQPLCSNCSQWYDIECIVFHTRWSDYYANSLLKKDFSLLQFVCYVKAF